MRQQAMTRAAPPGRATAAARGGFPGAAALPPSRPFLFLCAALLLPAPAVAVGDGPVISPAPAAPVPSGDGAAGAAQQAIYRRMLAREAEARGLPPAVADAVAYVESGYDAGAVGGVGELGLMQVRPATAAMLGHTGSAGALLDPATNIRFGVAYLAQAWKLAQGDLCRTLMKYRAGHGEERMSPRSITYCQRVRVRLAGTGVPLAGTALPAPDRSGREVPAAPSASRDARSAVARRLWAEHAARVRSIGARIDRIMGGG
ncbi:lytic transglycosylase [Methylobacterium variabile]|uniref:Lytic transglycosylase n=1 Tax=Methylobacterium variabile TaxID=298794 RepID=A0A0J6SPJ9_9HYPH|nr:transglycosylase SLT domain-containing protein [Methylobacterium variabile]KMO35313.1 lytic transglycosylase [Methylobacterium variabile]